MKNADRSFQAGSNSRHTSVWKMGLKKERGHENGEIPQEPKITKFSSVA